MRLPFRLAAVLALAVSAAAARGDRYLERVVLYSPSSYFYAANEFGDYIIAASSSPCGDSSDSCFLTYYAAAGQTVKSSTPPTLTHAPDPASGIGCGFDLSRYGGAAEVFCNNGHELIFGYGQLGGGREVRGIFQGPDPLADRISGSVVDGGIFTANGSLYFINGIDDSLRVITDLDTIPAPEPSSIALLGTGLIGIGTAVRRRFS